MLDQNVWWFNLQLHSERSPVTDGSFEKFNLKFSNASVAIPLILFIYKFEALTDFLIGVLRRF